MRQEEIMRVLCEAGRPLSVYEISERLGVPSRSGRGVIMSRLKRMEAYEQVRIHHTEPQKHYTRIFDVPFWEVVE